MHLVDNLVLQRKEEEEIESDIHGGCLLMEILE